MKLLVALLLALSPMSYAGNGSSGIGNRVSIGGGITASIATRNAISVLGNHVVDGISGEHLIKIEHVSKASLKEYGDQLVKSRLGSVDGYEFLPTASGMAKSLPPEHSNFWIICGEASGQCLQLVPESDTNPKVQDVIGALNGKLN